MLASDEFHQHLYLMFHKRSCRKIYFTRIFERLFPGKTIMGCSAGKLIESRKLKDPDVITLDNVKIQTVLKLNTNDNKKRSKSSKDIRGRRRKRNDSHNRKNSETHRKSSKTRNERTPSKPAYDSKITAKYDIKAMIGKGSFSRVLRVENRISKQPYALKIIEAPGGREAFEAELSVLRRLNHPNVIKLIEVFESNHKVYMVMELATGGSLLDRLETKGYLLEDDSRDVIKMVLNGVQYLHILGIAHRDLKPDNLLYYHPGKESRIMITDFSLASTRRSTGNPYMHTVCGTPQYIAPEIVSRKPYTCAVDIWAVGVILYITLCGQFPFDAEHDAQIFKLILRGKVPMTDPMLQQDESKQQQTSLSEMNDLNDSPLAHEELQNNKYMCSICYKQFLSKWNLKEHIQIHTDEKAYTCDDCQKPLSRKHESEMLTASYSVSPVVCKLCEDIQNIIRRLKTLTIKEGI